MADDGKNEERKSCLSKINELVEQYSARRKEIEDSFVECGLEVPLVTRNLNATVNPVGPSFEPVGRDYRIRVDEEAKSRPAPDYDSPASDDVESSPEDRLRRISTKIAEVEDKMVKASLEDDFDAYDRLEKEARDLRVRRGTAIAEIKSARTRPSVDEDAMKRIESLEAECRALRSQISMVRGDVVELMNQMDEVVRRLGMDTEMDEEDD